MINDGVDDGSSFDSLLHKIPVFICLKSTMETPEQCETCLKLTVKTP